MSVCEWSKVCPFFADEIGYSIGLFSAFRSEYCYGDQSRCVRLIAVDYLPLNEIPDDLLPTDHERLEELVQAHNAEKK